MNIKQILWRERSPLGRMIVSWLMLTELVALPALACSLSDRTTTEVTATTEPEIVPTQAPQVIAPTQVPTRPPAIAARTPTLKPQIKLEVGSYTSYPSSIGGLYIVGEVLNRGDAPAWQIQVAVSLLDNGGNVLGASSSNLAGLSVVPPGAKYPFLILISKAPSAYKETKIQVQAEPYPGTQELAFFAPYLDLKVEGITGKKPQFGGYTLSGRIINTGNKNASLVKVVSTAYDQNGKVVDVGWTFSKLDQIQAGGNAPFELEFRNLKEAPSKYDVYVQGTEKR